MALPNLDKLVAKCDALGLKVTPAGKKLGKADCVAALRQYYLPEGGLPFTEVTPMLCFADWNLKPAELKDMQTGPNWVVQRKLNGCRLILHAVKGKGWFAHSRTESVKTFRYEEATPAILFAGQDPGFDATVDCEVMIEKPIDTSKYTPKGGVTKSSLHSVTSILHLRPANARAVQIEQDAPMMFHVFDIMAYQGRDVKSIRLKNRLEILEQFKIAIVGLDAAKYFVFPQVIYEDRPTCVTKIIADGGEGGIYKHLNSLYEDSSSRNRLGWIKSKKRIEYDAFVTGFIRGEEGSAWRNLVGAIQFSVYLEDGTIHPIGMASSISMEQRLKISTYDSITDTVSMVSGIYGKVAEISGQDITARVLRLSHCTIDKWRDKTGPDAKTKEQCQVKMEDLQQAADWVG